MWKKRENISIRVLDLVCDDEIGHDILIGDRQRRYVIYKESLQPPSPPPPKKKKKKKKRKFLSQCAKNVLMLYRYHVGLSVAISKPMHIHFKSYHHPISQDILIFFLFFSPISDKEIKYMRCNKQRHLIRYCSACIILQQLMKIIRSTNTAITHKSRMRHIDAASMVFL